VLSLWRFYTFFWYNLVEECCNLQHFRLFTAKRITILLSLLVIFPALIVWNHVGFFLDDWLFPNWSQQSVKRPLFIIGNARSGTTMCHRQLADAFQEKFTSMKSWEIIFAASITWRLLFHRLHAIDTALGSYFLTLLLWVEAKLVDNSAAHVFGLFKEEEDEWLMALIFRSQLVLFFFPCGGSQLNFLVEWDPFPGTIEQQIAQKKEIFVFYAACVRRHLYYHRLFGKKSGSADYELVYLSKNPAFTMRLETIHTIFPDARIACLIRDPQESIPSMISYISQIWRTFSCPVQRYPNVHDLLQFCIHHYLFPQAYFQSSKFQSEEYREARHHMVSYGKLKTSLKSAILEFILAD